MIWKPKRNLDRRQQADRRPTGRGSAERLKRRSRGPERLEARRLLAADPIHVGVVYLETDYLESDLDVGSDSRGDRFILSFTGGAPDTQLSQLRIRTDKDGDGLSVGDPIYDTAQGGRGKNGAHGFQIVRVQSASGQSIQATAEVEDGGQELILRLSNFRAGDRIEFTIDVDEVLRNAIDLAVFNDRLDVITSGQEFQDSILEATFDAPHYETTYADAVFLNDYGVPAATHGLDLPPDEGNDIDSRPNRSAAAVASSTQTPKPIEISGHVWLDHNLDAIREPGEPAVDGVEISLWKRLEDGSYLDTGHRSITDSSGRYLFGKALGLLPGQYRVTEAQPEGLYSVAAVPGTWEGQTAGVVESVDALTDIHIPLGDTAAIHLDFAEAPPAALSGFVYRDDDNDGVREPSETGIAGVRIQLIPINTIAPQSTLTVTTSGDGAYTFTGLAPGSYEVIEVDQPPNLDDGLDRAGTVGGQVVGSAENPGDRITQIVLAGDDRGIDYNFGEIRFASISGFVYLAAPGQDCTGDHRADGSLLLPGVELWLQTESGETVASTTTGTDGQYAFDRLSAGNYRIIEFTPSGLMDGAAHVGRIGEVRVGSSTDGGLIQQITMTPSGAGREYNFCEAAPASISGHVYHDQSNDGIRDAEETPIPGVRVSLIGSDGQLVDSTDTDAAGRYEFTDVPPGEYALAQHQPADYLDGIDSVGTIRGARVGRTSGNDTLGAITLNQGDRGVEYNFGELMPASLSGRVHLNRDGDCEFDDDDLPLAGVTIRLIDARGNAVAQTQTDDEGRYAFERLAPGMYTVIQDQPPAVLDGNASAGSAGGIVENSNRIGSITLASGENAIEYDFCEREGAELSGSVFNDVDGDCVFHANDPGIESVRVELYDSAGNLIAATLTDSQGNYRFTHLPRGIYTVREVQPAGWLQGGHQAGTGGGDDSIPDVIRQIPLDYGERLTQYNFCELKPSSIGGLVFADANGDCHRDAGESTIQGVTVELRDASGRAIASTTTDADGRYQFSGLAPGRYQIFEYQPEGYFHGGQRAGSGDGVVLAEDLLGVELQPGQHLVDYNFCELEPASISGTVHVEVDGNCVFSPQEQPVDGVTIELRDENGIAVARTVTNDQGRYHFDGLPPGRYQIFQQQPDGVFHGGQAAGTGDGAVLGRDLLAANLSAGQQLVDYTFCELPPASISGKVWQESEPNLRYQPGDSPIEGVLIELIDGDGHVAATTRTNREGDYVFQPLAPSVYSVRQVQPDGFFHGGQVVGDAGGQVGGNDLLVGITLLGGTNADHYGFVEIPPSRISGFVFQDGKALVLPQIPDPRDLREFRDGALTPDDTPLGGVILELRDVSGLPLTADHALAGLYEDGPIRTVTDPNGHYAFDGLRPGTYHVYQVQPDGYIDGIDTPGSTGGVAVNPADVVGQDDEIVIRALASDQQTDPKNDAILNISLPVGRHSSDNNFSEIVVVDPQLPEPDSPTRSDAPIASGPAGVVVPIVALDSRIRLATYIPPPAQVSAVPLIDDWAVSWHLSVINGGFPRGTVSNEEIVHSVRHRLRREHWKQGDHARGRWMVRADREITLGAEGATALAGDFDGDGVDEAAIYVGGHWLVDLNGNGRWDEGDLWIGLGTELDRPVVGDWDGDGKDDVGIFGRQWLRDPQRINEDPGLPDPANRRRRQVKMIRASSTDRVRGEDRPRLLRRGNDGSLRADAVDHVFKYGEQVDTPLAGDWNGDGIDQIAVFRGGSWLLDSDGDGRWTSDDQKVRFGRPGDQPIVGDFNGDEIDEIGVVRGDLWIIDSDGDRRITGNDRQIIVPRQGNDSQPVVGDFDGDGKDEPGYYDEQAG